MDSPGKNTGVGCHFLLQRIFLTQGSNPGLLHSRQTLYRLSVWILHAVFIIITVIIIQFLLIHPVLSNPWEIASSCFPLWLQLISWLKKTTHPSFVVAVQSLSCVQLFAAPWTETDQASLSFTISWSLLKSMSIDLMMPSNHLIFSSPLLLLPFLASETFPMSQLFTSGGQSIEASLNQLKVLVVFIKIYEVISINVRLKKEILL